MEILTGAQMRNVDRRAIDELGIPGFQLMENAGRAVAQTLLRDHAELSTAGCLVLCGRGNNGGDGMVAARHLLAQAVPVRLMLFAAPERLEGDAARSRDELARTGFEIDIVADEAAWAARRGALDGGVLVLDALLGTGIKGGARGLAARVIEDLNASGCRVVSVDVPSGIDADSARLPPVSVRAGATYTLCRPKLALALDPAATRSGTLRILPIGIPDSAVAEESCSLEWLDEASLRGLLPPREPRAHKGSFGHLLAVAGSSGKSGAAVLLSRAALRCGVGLVTVATPLSSQATIAVQQAEVMTEPLDETPSGELGNQAAPRALELLASRQALAIGPGLGQAPATAETVRRILAGRRCPAVVDADALNAIAPATPGPPERPWVLTPHPGEAGRLLGRSTADIEGDRLEAVRLLACASAGVAVLKGRRTLVGAADGRVCVNSTGNPGMASAGCGDVLTGMIGALLARGLAARDAARLGVWLHGLAGDLAEAELGQEGMIAGDLVDKIPRATQILLHREEARR